MLPAERDLPRVAFQMRPQEKDSQSDTQTGAMDKHKSLFQSQGPVPGHAHQRRKRCGVLAVGTLPVSAPALNSYG
jgi:hypothetical protein